MENGCVPGGDIDLARSTTHPRKNKHRCEENKKNAEPKHPKQAGEEPSFLQGDRTGPGDDADYRAERGEQNGR